MSPRTSYTTPTRQSDEPRREYVQRPREVKMPSRIRNQSGGDKMVSGGSAAQPVCAKERVFNAQAVASDMEVSVARGYP